MTQPRDMIVSTTHSFYIGEIKVDANTRLGELMEYNANRITRETVGKISDVLAADWLEKNIRSLADRQKILTEAKRKIIERIEIELED